MQTTVEPPDTTASERSGTTKDEPAFNAVPEIVLTDSAAMKRAAKAALTTIVSSRIHFSPVVYRRAVLVKNTAKNSADLYTTNGKRALRWRIRARAESTPNPPEMRYAALDHHALRELAGCRTRATAGASLIRTANGGTAYRLTPKTGNPHKIPWQTCPGNNLDALPPHDAEELGILLEKRIFQSAEETSAWDLIGTPRAAAVEALGNLPQTEHGLLRVSSGALAPDPANEEPETGNTIVELRATSCRSVGPSYMPDATITGRSATPPPRTPICVSARSLRQILARMSGPKVDIRLPYDSQPLLLIARGGDETAVLQQLRLDGRTDA